MTAGAGRQQDRYNQMKDTINSGKYTGDNDALTNALYNFVFGGNGYKTKGSDWEKYGTPDLNRIARSDSKYWSKEDATKDALNDYRDYYLEELSKDLDKDNQFDVTNYGYVNDLMNNSQNYVGDFLQNYYDDTYSQLEAAQKRGLLTDTSFNKGIDYLNNKNSTWNKNLGDDLNTLISDYGKQYNTTRDEYNENRDSSIANLKNSFLSDYTGNYNELNDLRNAKNIFDNTYGIDNLYNDFLTGALSSTNSLPFDISEIIANAKIGSGINNVQSNELLQAIEDNEKQEDKKIGLGNQGVF